MGTIGYDDLRQITMADLPGLIEGAHKGVGLGYQFLKHIERCKSLLHIIDINENDLIGSYKIIREELRQYSEKLLKKKEIVVFNKIDLLEEEEKNAKLKEFKKFFKKKFYEISILQKKNISAVLRVL